MRKNFRATGNRHKPRKDLTSNWEPTLPYVGQREFLDAYRKEFGHDPTYHSAAAYGGCQVYAEAARRAGTLEADKLRDALLKLRIQTVFGDYEVDADGFQIAHKMVIFQWQDGKKVTVWPASVATGMPRAPARP